MEDDATTAIRPLRLRRSLFEVAVAVFLVLVGGVGGLSLAMVSPEGMSRGDQWAVTVAAVLFGGLGLGGLWQMGRPGQR